ncbi:MAG: hypothetical protein IPH05_00335 [Flavobacteriales bacterium]|jgi:hypothetical protein|nr:hypothetical protein [Flavobacteriales bacterium]MBK6552224.1 hypothetical protein [Flavobacteriales bacterium]MBK6881395.1 hypothetical protein [Flavobacteriales bacterium]MBK7102710.1 hypothetical protein [Flavobacteriales bacterium]MBK7113683.1 hypothetical protein [Flavobacteriales bacterium]
MKQLFILPVAAMLFASCGDGKMEAAQQMADSTATVVEPWVVNLAAMDIPAVVELGDRATLQADSAAVRWNEEFGHVEVRVGDHFAITISEEPGDIVRLKADLDRDMLRKHTILEETPDKVIFRSQFPDEDLVFIHFYQVIPIGDRTFVVEDAAEGRFNEADIKRMAGSVQAHVAS